MYSEKTQSQYVLVPVCANPVVISKGLVTYTHFHPVYHIVFVTGGEGMIETDVAQYPLTETDILIINPNEKHVYFTDSDEGMQHFTINFMLIDAKDYPAYLAAESGDTRILDESNKDYPITARLDELFEINMKNSFVYYDKNQWFRFVELIDQFHKALKNFENSPYYIIYDNALIAEQSNNFVITLYHFMNLIDNLDNHHPTKDWTVRDELLNKILGALNSKVFTPFHLNDFAKYLHYSPEYLCGYFKQKTGITITQYLKKLRINKACEYLLNTNISITQVASLLNFCSSNHFCNAFKQEKKISPKEFRKSFR